MKKQILSLVLTLAMAISLLPVEVITASAADPVYDSNFTYTGTFSGSLGRQNIMDSGVYLLDNATIVAESLSNPGISITGNAFTNYTADVTLVVKGTVTVQGANGASTLYPGGAGILVTEKCSLKIVGYAGTTNVLNVNGGKGSDGENGYNGANATSDEAGSGGNGGYGGSGGGAAIGTNGGNGQTEAYQSITADPCGKIGIDTSNLTLNLTAGAGGNAGSGGNGGSSAAWSSFGAAARAGGGGGGGGGAGYAGQLIGTGGQGGYMGSNGGAGGSDGSSPCYVGGGGGGCGGNGSARGGGGGGGGRAIAYAFFGSTYTYSGASGGAPSNYGSSNSSDGTFASNADDGRVSNGFGGGIAIPYGGDGGYVPSNGSAGVSGGTNNTAAEQYTSYKTICFNANGGSASSFTMVTGNTVDSLPANNPSRTDYTFKGWASSKTATTANVTATTILGSVANTCYAVWERNLYDATVTVNKNSSVWTDVASDKVVLSTSASTPDLNKKTATPSNGVFTFSGIDPDTTMYVWAKNSAGTYINTGSVSSSNTSMAVNYYDVGLSAGTGIKNVSGAGTYLKGETVKIGATISSGYTWDKWSDNDTTMTDRAITVNQKYDLTANAVAIPATAPTVSTAGTTLTYGYTSGNISITATPATGHTITGYQWYTCNSDGSGKSKVDGATSATYNIPTGKSVGSYYYVCDVTTTRTDNSQTKTVTTSPPTLVTVNKIAITITMNNKSRNYGDANPTFDFTITSGSLGNSDTNTALAITGATTATQTSDVETYDITGTSASTNYNVTINKGTLTINKKTSETTDFNYDLTSKTYNGNPQGITVTPKTGTGTITTYYEGVSPTSYTKSTTPPTVPGTYAVTIDVSNATNYLDILNLILGNYTINKADAGSLTLTFSKNPSIYEDEVTFTATAAKVGTSGAIPTGNITFKNGNTVLATVALSNGVATLKKSDLDAITHTITAEYGGDSNYNAKTSDPLTQVVNQKAVNFTISGQEQVYDGTAKGISIDNTGTLLTKSDFSIKYYLVNENEDVLTSTTPVTKAVSSAKYLYVIDFAGTNANYTIKNKFVVTNTTLPTISSYDNVGYMTIKSQTAQQKPIYFGEGIVNKLVGDNKFTNTLTNANASTVTYLSTNTNVAIVNSTTGEVTILKDGSTTIMAASTLSGTSDVFASYSLVVTKKQVTITAQDKTHTFGTPWDASNGSVTYSDGLSANDFSGTLTFTTNYTNGGRVGEYKITPSGLTSDKYSIIYESATLTVNPKTLTANDFNVKANDKIFNGNIDASLTVSTVNISGDVSTNVIGSFASADANDNANVSYKITGLTGRDADNYVLDGGSIMGTTTAKISKATVSIICASTTTRTFDDTFQKVDISAMANGEVFDSSNYTVKYNGVENVKNVGEYTITVVLNPSVENNYAVKPFTAKLVIKEAVQEVFSIESVPDRVYYGDTFKVTTQGASGTVAYSLNLNAPATIDTDGNVVATGTGTVTITATSTKDGYAPKIATKTFTVYQRVLTPTATATDREYDATNNVAVQINLSNGLGEDISAIGTGAMANADAGTDKMVYVSGIALQGDKKDFYTLSTTTLQTTVNIDRANITGFTISADSKKYDGTNVATATVTDVNGIFDLDKGQVNVVGSAMFNDELSGTGKIVTFTANGITGVKAGNYKLADSAKTATETADITPVNVNFTVGTATFKYDGDEKQVAISGVDEFGRVFSDYTVEYLKDNVQLSDIPSEAGDYTVKILLNDNANYTTTQQDISMVIAQASQEQITIVGLPGAIEYTDKFTLEAIGGSGTGNVVWTSDKSSVTVDSNGFVSIDGAVNEKVTITATKKDDTNFTEKTAKVVFIPQAKTTGFVIDNLVKTYDEGTAEVLVTPDVANVTYDVTYNGSQALPTNAGTYNVVVNATGNYKGSSRAVLTINKATMSGLEITQDGCTYGETLNDASYDNSPSGVNVSVKYSTFDGKKPTKAGDYVVTATYTGDNYETYAASASFVIKKKLLEVKADDKNRKYGEANPLFTLAYTGFEYGETASDLLLEPLATTIANASSPVKTDGYEITVSGGRADNYEFDYNNTGILMITGANGGNFYITGSNNSVTVGDIFTLHAYYDNAQPKVEWVSSDNNVASVDENGNVKIFKMGEATITATITDTNYESGISATFKLNASKKAIALKPADLVKVYNAERQDITLISDDANFVPILSGENKNIDITYTLTTDSSVTEPKQAGVYTVTYSINHPSYTGGETVTMYINKATATVTAHDLSKVYGQENPSYYITGLIGDDELNADYIAKISNMFVLTSDADIAGTKTNAGEYPITLAVKEGKTLKDDTNYDLVISDTKGKLTITKAPLNIKVSDASREYGDENANPAYEYVGFVNGETEADLTNKPVFTYDASITKETNVGLHADVITASGANSGNYEINYSYTDGTLANLTVTALHVTISAGSARSSYITVVLDKAISGLTKDNFVVTLDGTAVNIASATASSNNTAYILSGSFTPGSTYSVAVITNSNYAISGSPLSVIPRSSGGGGGGSADITTYKITVTQADGGRISPETVSVNKDESKTFTIIPNEGYEIEDVLVNGESIGKVNEYTFEKITSAGTITAKFKKIEPSEWKNPFSDVNENDWFYEAVKFVNEKGFMLGTTSSAFEPNGDVTRAMFVTVLYRIENEPNANTSLFNDLENGAYYEKAVSWASENGIVKGISETQFAPKENITREQMVAIIYRYAKYKGYDISVSGKTDYTDNASISDYAKGAVVWASNNGIITGDADGSFAPQDNSTRAQAAMVFMRIIENLK
ncbi:MAG: MBG domain-containing protein [Bacillota bacterium]|nr:MBG domain-containing protein [Bacillota bacterium]